MTKFTLTIDGKEFTCTCGSKEFVRRGTTWECHCGSAWQASCTKEAKTIIAKEVKS